ncbi:hypothetical protein H5410_036253 [Solanum commersonii]|uniref:Uncharacterized protein n=1 Tax=Solanum commersonii TaxID=4109 RepID=A0A9J5Y493_SOLCO|nr:hypothetical protein H5410_036253 [Solanum commersonii]
MGKGYVTRVHPLGKNLILTHSLGDQSSDFGFATSLSGKPKTHGKMNKEDPLQNLGKKSSFLQVSTKPSPNLRENIH